MGACVEMAGNENKKKKKENIMINGYLAKIYHTTYGSKEHNVLCDIRANIYNASIRISGVATSNAKNVCTNLIQKSEKLLFVFDLRVYAAAFCWLRFISVVLRIS